MDDCAGTAGIRACAVGCALTLLALAAFSPSPAGAARSHTSIVNGHSASIKDWPWQVAIAVAKRRGPRAKPRARFFCGGALIAPDLVLTAGHCVADLSPKQIRRLEVISGRTRLNRESTGQVAPVAGRIMPVNSHGTRRFQKRGGVNDWDVALLRLSRSLPAETIRIAGPDEEDLWSPGRTVNATGWGVARSSDKKVSPVLRTAPQVMLGGAVCRQFNRGVFRERTMNCLGGPSVNTSTCFGDSGGPLVAPDRTGHRLIGVTSFGDADCRPALPSIDTRVASDPIRGWIRGVALGVSGVDVVGAGAVAPPKRDWCRVPKLVGLTVKLARGALSERGCRLGQVRRLGRGTGISATSMAAGWFTPPGRRVRVWIGR